MNYSGTVTVTSTRTKLSTLLTNAGISENAIHCNSLSYIAHDDNDASVYGGNGSVTGKDDCGFKVPVNGAYTDPASGGMGNSINASQIYLIAASNQKVQVNIGVK